MASERGTTLLGFPLYVAMHSARVLGYMPLLLAAAYRWPLRAAEALCVYYSLRFKSETWRRAIRRLLVEGSSTRPRLIRAQAAPYEKDKQYILAAHPHGILNYGWWNLICRHGGAAPLLDGVELVMCMAPAVQWYPLFGELFGDRATDASAATLRRVLTTTRLSVGLIPGGFSEAVYTAASPTVEHAYMADRRGFIKLAIEHKAGAPPARPATRVHPSTAPRRPCASLAAGGHHRHVHLRAERYVHDARLEAA